MKHVKFFVILLLIGVIIASVLFAYWELPKTFFQQDEWIGFGIMIYQELKGGLENILISPILQGRGHFSPLIFYQNYLEFKFFGLSLEPYTYVSITTHIANSLLLFYFVYLLLKNKFLAFCSSLVFSINSVSSQAVTWMATSPITQGAVFFLLLSLILTLKYFKNNNKKNYYIGLAFFSVGILSKETVLFLFILYPLMWFLFAGIKSRKHFYLFLKPLVVLGFIYILVRVSLFFVPSQVGTTSGNTVNLDVVSDIVRLIISPFRILPQAIIPQHYLINFSDMATLFFYPQQASGGIVNPYFSQTIVFGQVIPLLSAPILLVGFIVYKFFLRKKEYIFSRALVFSLLLITLSGLPFAFIPGEIANFPIYESRHLHVASIGVSIFLVLILYALVKFFLKKSKYVPLVLFIILIPILLAHLTLTRMEINKTVAISTTRKNILESIKMSYPRIPKKAVFYIESNMSYYGLPIEEKIFPFQSNFGHMLIVWYQNIEKFPGCFYEGEFLRGLLKQGYKDCGGRGFGYFRDYDKLIYTINENKIPVNNIIAYSWNGKTEKFKDITREVRTKIKEHEKNFKQ